jgi:hypothetical protein
MWKDIFAVSPEEFSVICGFGLGIFAIASTVTYGVVRQYLRVSSNIVPLYDSPTVEADQVRSGYSLEDSRIVPDLLSGIPQIDYK